MRILKKIIGYALLSTCLLFPLLSHNAYASDRQSMKNLNQMADRYRYLSGGWCRPRARGIGYLKQGKAKIISTTLYRGYDYAIFAAGDHGTKDIDLVIYDENYNRVDRDTKSDNVPLLTNSPKWTGRFYIKASMASGSGYVNVAICHEQPNP